MVFNTHDRTPRVKNKKSIVIMLYGLYALFFAMIIFGSVVCSFEVGNILPALLISGPFLILSLIFFILKNDIKKSCVIIEGDYIKAVDYYFGKKFEKTFRKDEIKKASSFSGNSLKVQGLRYSGMGQGYIVFYGENNKYLFKIIHVPETKKYFSEYIK